MPVQVIDSAIVQKGRLLPGIHGLRGIAATAVVLYHLEHLTKFKPPDLFVFIGRDFGFSVHLFFVVSAFSLMYSTESSITRKDWLFDYFTKRLFRIAPLFYFIVAFELSRQLLFGGIVTKVLDIFLSLTFSFGAVPNSGFVWGGWSVGVEMIFYTIFPVLLLTIRTHRSALFFLVISVFVSCTIRVALHEQHIHSPTPGKWDWSYFSFSPNFCFFVMGISAYRFSKTLKADAFIVKYIIPPVTTLLICTLFFANVRKYLYGGARLDIVVWGIAFSLLCLWQSLNPTVIVANKALEFLGERSFSIYLLHPIIITLIKPVNTYIYNYCEQLLGNYAFFACAVVTIGVILPVAEVTYRLIEIPGINLGRSLISQRRSA